MSEDVLEQAALWHAAQDSDDMPWDAFTAWLEANTRHRDAFDDVALFDERIGRNRDALRSAFDRRDHAPAPPPTRRFARWGAAAVAVAALGVTLSRETAPRPAGPTRYRAGTVTRLVDLADGARASLAPGSVLVAEGNDAGLLTLSGRALFEVRHDAGREVTVRAEGYRIRDVGTRFEVVTGHGMMRVAVAQGRVGVARSSGGAEVELGAGRSLTGFADGRLLAAPARTRDVGSWRAGPLVYDAVPLAMVAADVSRMAGRRVEVDRAVQARPFSGVLATARGDRMAEALAALTGLQARRDGETIRLGDRPSR